MNIDVVGRVRPSLRGEGPCNLELDGNRLADRPGGTYYRYNLNLLKLELVSVKIMRMISENFSVKINFLGRGIEGYLYKCKFNS